MAWLVYRSSGTEFFSCRKLLHWSWTSSKTGSDKSIFYTKGTEIQKKASISPKPLAGSNHTGIRGVKHSSSYDTQSTPKDLKRVMVKSGPLHLLPTSLWGVRAAVALEEKGCIGLVLTFLCPCLKSLWPGGICLLGCWAPYRHMMPITTAVDFIVCVLPW